MQKLYLNQRERERESSSRLICHIERSEISQVESHTEPNGDISVSAKLQYDNAGGHNVISPSIVGGNPTYSPPATRVGLGGGLIPPPPLKQS